MNKVLIYSLFLIFGLVESQFIPLWLGNAWLDVSVGVRLTTMVTLAFIMIYVGYEFEIDLSRPKLLVVYNTHQ